MDRTLQVNRECLTPQFIYLFSLIIGSSRNTLLMHSVCYRTHHRELAHEKRNGSVRPLCRKLSTQWMRLAHHYHHGHPSLNFPIFLHLLCQLRASLVRGQSKHPLRDLLCTPYSLFAVQTAIPSPSDQIPRLKRHGLLHTRIPLGIRRGDLELRVVYVFRCDYFALLCFAHRLLFR